MHKCMSDEVDVDNAQTSDQVSMGMVSDRVDDKADGEHGDKVNMCMMDAGVDGDPSTKVHTALSNRVDDQMSDQGNTCLKKDRVDGGQCDQVDECMLGTAEVPGDQVLKYMGDEDAGQGDAGQEVAATDADAEKGQWDDKPSSSSSKPQPITQCPTKTGPVARYVEIPDIIINATKLIVNPIGMMCEDQAEQM